MVTVTCPIPACCLRFWPKDLEAHKKVCEFMPIKCPYFSCIARLPMVPENISQHLVAEHGATRNGTEPPLGVRTPRRSSHMFTSQLTLPLPTAGTAGNGASGPTIQIISALRSQFIMWFEQSDDYFIAWLQIQAPPTSASEFSYKLCWEKLGHSVCYKGPVRSVTREAHSIQADGEYLSVPSAMVLSGRGNRSTLELNLGIMKAEDESSGSQNRESLLDDDADEAGSDLEDLETGEEVPAQGETRQDLTEPVRMIQWFNQRRQGGQRPTTTYSAWRARRAGGT